MDTQGNLEEMTKQRDEYKEISELFQGQREDARKQRAYLRELLDASLESNTIYQDQRDRMEKQLSLTEEKYNGLLIDYRAAEEQLEGSWSTLETGLLTSAVGLGALLAGGVAGYLIALE